VVARPARDLLQAGRQQITRDWWNLKRSKHELFTSQLDLIEIGYGERQMAELRLRLLEGLPLLETTEEARELTRSIMRSGLLPAKAEGDALHIALATLHKMDILLTWNCRHIANGFIQARMRQCLATSGFNAPTICTPEELFQSPYEPTE
jgi:hypothetical protein